MKLPICKVPMQKTTGMMTGSNDDIEINFEEEDLESIDNNNVMDFKDIVSEVESMRMPGYNLVD